MHLLIMRNTHTYRTRGECSSIRARTRMAYTQTISPSETSPHHHHPPPPPVRIACTQTTSCILNTLRERSRARRAFPPKQKAHPPTASAHTHTFGRTRANSTTERSPRATGAPHTHTHTSSTYTSTLDGRSRASHIQTRTVCRRDQSPHSARVCDSVSVRACVCVRVRVRVCECVCVYASVWSHSELLHLHTHARVLRRRRRRGRRRCRRRACTRCI